MTLGMRRIATRASFIGLVSLLDISLPGSASAWAPNEIYACGQSCRTDCTGHANCRTASGSPPKCIVYDPISCTSAGSAIRLVNGTDLDLQSTITCTETDPSTCAYPAIVMDDSGSKITNSGSSEAIISGRFSVGVDCWGYGSSIVEKITVEDGYVAIANCQTVRNTVVGPTTQFYVFSNWGITTTGISNADSINDNFVSGRLYPIYSSSSYALDVQRNVIFGTGNAAIRLHQSSASGNVKNNVVFSSDGGGSTVISSSAGPNFDGNFCAPDISGCGSCISAGQCEPYTSPFIGN